MVAWPSPDARQRNYVVVGRCGGTPRVDGREVVEGRFFALTALPHPFRETHSSRLDRWLSVYREL